MALSYPAQRSVPVYSSNTAGSTLFRDSR